MNKVIKKLKKYLGLLLILLGIISIFYPMVYWFINDYLTEMQVFKDIWYLLPLSAFLLMYGCYLVDINNKNS